MTKARYARTTTQVGGAEAQAIKEDALVVRPGVPQSAALIYKRDQPASDVERAKILGHLYTGLGMAAGVGGALGGALGAYGLGYLAWLWSPLDRTDLFVLLAMLWLLVMLVVFLITVGVWTYRRHTLDERMIEDDLLVYDEQRASIEVLREELTAAKATQAEAVAQAYQYSDKLELDLRALTDEYNSLAKRWREQHKGQVILARETDVQRAARVIAYAWSREESTARARITGEAGKTRYGVVISQSVWAAVMRQMVAGGLARKSGDGGAYEILARAVSDIHRLFGLRPEEAPLTPPPPVAQSTAKDSLESWLVGEPNQPDAAGEGW